MKYVAFGLVLALLIMPMVLAEGADINPPLDPKDKQKFDQILQPVMKIYNFVKYIVTIIAALFLLFAGVTFMMSGEDPRKRDQAKNIAMYVIIGLLIIWGTPAIVGLLTT